MPELWFVAGLAFGMVLMGFCTIGSFDRGADSVRVRTWKLELVARHRASIASRSRHAVAIPFTTDLVNVPVAAAVIERPSMRPVPAAERRTRIRRTPDEVLAHISL
jgi:hypothetical protein